MVLQANKVYSRLRCHGSCFLEWWSKLNGRDDSAKCPHTRVCLFVVAHTQTLHKYRHCLPEAFCIFLTPLITCTHTHTLHPLMHSVWLMAPRTMSGMYSLTWALVYVRVCMCGCVCKPIWCQQGWFTLTYPPTTGIIPPASWRAHINTHTRKAN